MKYRLYAIDPIISRVISYAIITTMLAGMFAGLVLLATDVLPFKTPVAVAAATLAAAALFNALRSRVQRAVDRRFNRARYNAEAVVADWSVRAETTRGDHRFLKNSIVVCAAAGVIRCPAFGSTASSPAGNSR